MIRQAQKVIIYPSDGQKEQLASAIDSCCWWSNQALNKSIDLGVKNFAIVHDGRKTRKYTNLKHCQKHEKNLALKQKKLARKQLGSKSRQKAIKTVAKVYTAISNTHQDFLHKLSIKLTKGSQVIVGENLNVKGMVCNQKLAKAISDVGWRMFVNFNSYKLEKTESRLARLHHPALAGGGSSSFKSLNL